MSEQMGLTVKKEKDFSEWYHELIRKTLIDQRYPLQGFLVYVPYGYETFSNCIKILEELLVQAGHKKCYFPTLIPEKLLGKEEQHIKGFSEEVFWVTHSGLTKMEEKAALRPTSETAMYEMLSLWIRSWRDLPLKIHQSCSVFRYETKHTRPMIRDREILWNEAHTSHATKEEAAKQMEDGIRIYKDLFERLTIPVLFLDVVSGVFAGAEAAVEPYTIFPDGRSLEMGSVNNLGQRFSKVFNVKFKKEDETEDYVYQTSYGVSERLLAAITAIHGDNKGLILPPSIAPVQIIVVPIYFGKEKENVLKKAAEVAGKLNKVARVEIDSRDEYTPGFKFNEWEMKGVPLRIEIGPKDIEKKSITVVRRDNKEKTVIKENAAVKEISKLLDSIQESLKERAQKYFESKIKNAKDLNEIKTNIKNGLFSRIAWCGKLDCASHIEKSTDAVFIGKEHKGKKAGGKCICGNDGKYYGYVGKTY